MGFVMTDRLRNLIAIELLKLRDVRESGIHIHFTATMEHGSCTYSSVHLIIEQFQHTMFTSKGKDWLNRIRLNVFKRNYNGRKNEHT